MIVDYLTFTFAEEHEDKLADLVKKIDPGAVSLETKSGHTEYWSLWGNHWLRWVTEGMRSRFYRYLAVPLLSIERATVTLAS